MRLRISSRKSDLARLQAYRVAEALKKAHPGLEIEFRFKESLGDKNLTDPLWKMPEKGVFTEDFQQELLNNETDMVVHSWKDLPTEEKAQTEIVATLPRADQRDLLLLKSSEMEKIRQKGSFKILSSSPRRAYNLSAFLQEALPLQKGHAEKIRIEFESVRGNIPTRLRKLIQSTDAQGLVLAKAALDRLLSAPEPEFHEVQNELKAFLRQCQWMVLPLSINPNAAAQGALAVEILRSRKDLKKFISLINDDVTFWAARREREFLASFGGGCHQKIGIAVLPRPYGLVQISRGLADSGQKLQQCEVASERRSQKKFSAQEMWPLAHEASSIFRRVRLPWTDLPQEVSGIYVAKSEAWPESLQFSGTVWTSGIATWKKLASQGVWVHGCSDGFGEDEFMDLSALIEGAGKPPVRWAKLTHEIGQNTENKMFIPTYKLEKNDSFPDLRDKKSFFWSSGSLFLQALKEQPSIADEHHACGPGHTYKIIQQTLENMGKHSSERLEVFLTHEEWEQKCKK
jgi:hydroxymethylbilane synthase